MRAILFQIAAIHRAGPRLFVSGRSCGDSLTIGDVIGGPGNELRVESILTYRRFINVLDPGLTAEIELSGPGTAALQPGSNIAGTRTTRLPPLDVLGEGEPHGCPGPSGSVAALPLPSNGEREYRSSGGPNDVSEPTSMRAHEREILKQIAAAFADVHLGSGISLRETRVIDGYGALEERQRVRQADETHDWQRVVRDPELLRLAYVGGLAFYDAQGMRFHLPAYLSLAVTRFEDREADNVLEVLMNTLTHPSRRADDPFSLLTPTQRRCVADVLSYLREMYALTSPELDAAIAWWSRAVIRREGCEPQH